MKNCLGLGLWFLNLVQCWAFRFVSKLVPIHNPLLVHFEIGSGFNCREYFSPCYKICFTFRTSHILFSCVSVQYFLYTMKMRMPLYIQDNLGLYTQIYVTSKHKIQITVCCQYCRFLIYRWSKSSFCLSPSSPPRARKNPNLAFY